MRTTNKFSPEVRKGAVRLVLDNKGWHESRWQAVVSISAKIRCAPQPLNEWVKRSEVDSGQRAGIPSEMAEKMKAFERENCGLRQVNEIFRKASAYFAMAGSTAGRSNGVVYRRASGDTWGRADLPSPWASDQLQLHGSMLPIASSPCCAHLAKRADPARLSDRARRDEGLHLGILRVSEENWRVCGVRKIWRQLGREGFNAVRCTLAGLMKDMDFRASSGASRTGRRSPTDRRLARSTR